MSELMKQKLEIATRAGSLSEELASLNRMKEWLEKKKTAAVRNGIAICDPIHVYINKSGSENWLIDSYKWDKDGTTLHDTMLQFVDAQINKRINELDELIKILQ